MEPFRAGQFVKIGLEMGGDIVGRPYSLVNAPQEQTLEFYFSVIPEGPLSPRLATLAAGDRVLVAPHASGFLVLDEVPPANHLWLLSTGTGIGPFLSILKTADPWRRFQRVVLVHAVRSLDELSYRRTIVNIAEANMHRFCYIPLVSREAADYALSGRIPLAIADGRLEARAHLALDPAQSHVMLCGNPAMIEESVAVLKSRGLTKNRRKAPGQISVESYW